MRAFKVPKAQPGLGLKRPAPWSCPGGGWAQDTPGLLLRGTFYLTLWVSVRPHFPGCRHKSPDVRASGGGGQRPLLPWVKERVVMEGYGRPWGFETLIAPSRPV